MGRKKKIPRQLTRLKLRQITLSEIAGGSGHDVDEIEMLAQSMISRGQLEPVLVKGTSRKNRFQLIVGSKRFAAAKKLGWGELDCLVLESSFESEIEVIEKLQSGLYEPWELADTLHGLKERLDWSQAQLGAAVGKSRDFVANILAIAQIAPEVRGFILSRDGGHRLTARHLRYVARAKGRDQMQIARRILADKLSTTKLEREKRSGAAKSADPAGIKIREFRKSGTARYPKNPKEWKRYYRQLNTDLRRVDKREIEEVRRSKAVVSQARQRQRIIKREANRKRRQLQREMRQALRHL